MNSVVAKLKELGGVESDLKVSSAVAKLKQEFKGIESDLKKACSQRDAAEDAEYRAKMRMRELRQKLRETFEAEYGVQIPPQKFEAFVEDGRAVMVIENGTVRVLKGDAAVPESAVKIYAHDWWSGYYD